MPLWGGRIPGAGSGRRRRRRAEQQEGEAFACVGGWGMWVGVSEGLDGQEVGRMMMGERRRWGIGLAATDRN